MFAGRSSAAVVTASAISLGSTERCDDDSQTVSVRENRRGSR